MEARPIMDVQLHGAIRTAGPLRALAIALALAAVWPGEARSGEDHGEVLFDFEEPGLSNTWKVVGRGEASRLPIPDPPEGGPAGHGVRVRAGQAVSLVTHPRVLPGDWSGFEALAMWIHGSAANAGGAPADTGAQTPVAIEVVVHEVDDNASFHRVVELDGVGWTRVELPLRWFRWGEGRAPRWDRVDHLAVSFREAGEFWLDGIELVRPGEGEPALDPTADELAALVEAGMDGAEATVLRTAVVDLVSAAPALDGPRLAEHLASVRAVVVDELAFIPDDVGPVPLVILPDDDAFVAFIHRLAAAYTGTTDPPGHDGYAMQGIAASGWSEHFGTLRPAYTHEYTHALVAAMAGLPNLGEWVQEGLATRIQLRFHPQADVPDLVRRGMASPSLHLPLPELCSGGPIPTDRYWQAMTVVDLLLEDARYAENVTELVGAFLASGSTDLAPHLGTVFGVTWERFEADWRAFVAGRYAADDLGEGVEEE